ncbi:MAG TPA: ATP-binding protein [bacterium]|nr:ATP-binding protein [bacterium]
MIDRTLGDTLTRMMKSFPVVTVTGPRQSGKTTLIRSLFESLPYASLEDPDKRERATSDPRGFLESLGTDGAIIDEAQRVPELFNYLQGIVDDHNRPGMFILSGSQNFLLLEKITQSLAGRVGIARLLPFSVSELSAAGKLPARWEDLVVSGGYPRIHATAVTPVDWYPNYIMTYLERDVRQLKAVSDLARFQTFLKLCAGRTGQLLNLSSLAADCGISHTTAAGWLSILEASYLVFKLTPNHRNFNKRLIRSPKLYFYDTGIACSLLGIRSADQLDNHFARGALFETLVVSELQKRGWHNGHEITLSFWRDQTGHEVDVVVERGEGAIPIEIKSGRTVDDDFFKGLSYYAALSDTPRNDAAVVYGGDERYDSARGRIYPWSRLNELDIG